MKSSNINQHLSHEQICDLLLSDRLAVAPAVDAAQELHQEHLQGCLICTSELELLRSSVTSFRTASVAVADRAMARRPLQAAFQAMDAKRSTQHLTPAFFWAATALIFTAAIPLGLFHTNLNPFLKHEAAAVATNNTGASTAGSNTIASNASIESDEALLEGINQDLSASVPSPMQALAGPASTQANSKTSSQQTQRNN
ncbi:MAG: hypothetical protein JWM43_193 [Acidobacteriaceae bacterium]|nr:hypothetical protein [Acidobacteriaceae bacterium]